MFSKSKRFGDIHGAKGPGPATYNIKRLFDASAAQQPRQRARKPQVLPMLLGKKPLMVLCKEPPKAEAQNPPANDGNDCNDWRDIFACHRPLAQGATGMVFSGAMRVQGTPCALKRILEREFNQKMATEFLQEFKVMKACDHTNIAKVFSAYEVPFPAFTMELLGKTLDQSTTDRDIDNEGVLIAFNDAAAAVQYLHGVKKIAHRDIKPRNFCHQLHCHSWAVKLIDFDAAKELKEYLLSLFNFNFEIDLAF